MELILSEKSNVPIIIYEPRGIDYIIYIIAVMKCNCYYIPLELNIPIERLQTIYEDVGSKLIISNEIKSDVMYIIYTSGTSGKTKGVKILYKNLYKLVNSYEDILYHKFSEKINVGVMASFSFDASVKQIYASLFFGHT